MRTALLLAVCALALPPLAAAPIPKKTGPTAEQLKETIEAFKGLGGKHREDKDQLTGQVRHQFVFTLRLPDDFAAELPKVPFPFGLEFVSLDLSDEVMKRIAGLENLTHLKLDAVGQLTDDGLAELGKARSLVELELTGVKLTCTGLKGLTDLGLTRLSLDKTHANDEALTAVGKMTTLTRLHLSGTKVTNSGASALVGLKNLTELDLDRAPVGDDGVRELSGLRKLTSLSLAGTQVTDDGMKHLAKLTALTYLTLSGCEVTDAGLKQLADLKALRSLSLTKTKLTDAGLKHLAGLKDLTELRLGYTAITDAGMKELTGLTKLTGLSVYDTQVTDEGVKTVQTALPNCDVTK